MTTPDYSTVLTNIRTALTEIEQAISSPTAVNVATGGVYTQADYPYWVNAITAGTPSKIGTGAYTFDLTIQALYHYAPLTSGIGTEAEIATQGLMLKALVTFSERILLQCTSFPNGVTGIRPTGITVQNGAVGSAGQQGQQTFAVRVNLIVPISVRMDTTNI